MGRKKAKATVEDNPEVQALEILVDILEGSGVFSKHSGDEDSWDRLSYSLENLAKRLENSSSRIFHSDQVDVAEEDLLLEIEEAAQEVRLRVSVLSDEIQEMPLELRLCQKLEATCPRLRPLARSLRGAVYQQRWIANDIFRSILQSLENLYTGKEEHNKAITELRYSSIQIRRRCIKPKSSPWRDAVLLLEDTAGRDLGESRSSIEDSNDCLDAIIDFDVDDDTHRTNYHPVVLNTNIIAVVKAFAFDSKQSKKKFVSMLVVGSEGSGKTYCCNEIEKVVKSQVDVIRPSLPYEVMGQTVGSTEDLLVSIVACAVGTTKPSILILDDIETIFGYEYDTSAKSMADPGGGGNNSREPHVTARVRAILFCLLDQLRNATNGDGRTLLICTSKINLGKSIDRFDAIFTLSSPGENEREVIISQHVDLFENRGILSSTTSSTELESMMLNLVECTSGLSYAELAQYCRQAVLVSHEQYQNSSQPNDNLKIVFLKALKQELQLSMPESLRRGINADFVDMKVMSAKDLQEISSVTEGSPVSLPLYGKSAEIAWQELLRTIVIPICQVGALDTLLHQQGGRGGKIFAGGVILTGDPGCGKSALAYHAAAVASTMNPSVKLVDVSCTSLISKEVGSSERSMHRLFEAARAAAPCILLMDGIENVAAVRGNDNTTEGTMDRVISTLLTELDGVDSEQFSQENPACLAIIGITHNSSWIDPALRRPGRLGSVIEVGRPEHEARKNIVLRELKESNYVHDNTIIDNSYHGLESLAEFVAAETEGLTGAVIIAVCNEAKVFSSRAWREDMTGQDVQLKPGHVLAAIKSRRAGVR